MNVEEVQEAVIAGGGVLARGGGSKPGLSRLLDSHRSLELGGLRGIVEYLPEEFTVTVLAGTPVAEIDALLGAHGQYLPFDPFLAGAGATAGGSVAAGANGPGRVRYGGVRDFLLGVRFVDGRGRLARGGGRVVKNAAGFDLPKLMVGSLGRLAVLVELAFKVFPAPEARRTLVAELGRVDRVLSVLHRLNRLPLDLEALDFEPAGRMWIRVGGPEAALPGRVERLRRELATALDAVGGAPRAALDVLEGDAEADHWRASRDLEWVEPESLLVKVPVTPGRIEPLESEWRAWDAAGARRYSGAGQQLLVTTTDSPEVLHRRLAESGLSGLVLRGEVGPWGPCLGAAPAGASFAERVKRTLDPNGVFPSLPLPPPLPSAAARARL